MTTKIVQLIFSDTERRGEGVKDDPIRCVFCLYTVDGKLIASQDIIDPSKNFISLDGVRMEGMRSSQA